MSYVVAVPSNLAVLEVIAEPTRRRILDAVRGGERSVGELVDEVGMHQPGVSRHLKVLRDAGLVEVRRDAQRRLYRLRAGAADGARRVAGALPRSSGPTGSTRSSGTSERTTEPIRPRMKKDPE